MSAVQELLDKKCTMITEAEAPHLFETIKKISAKANHKDAVLHEVYFINPSSGDLYDYLAGCMANGEKNVLILGEKIRKIFNHVSPSDKISEELEAVIAHEAGHARFRDLKSMGSHWMSFGSPLAGLLAGIGATALALHLTNKHGEDKEKQLAELDKIKDDSVNKEDGSMKFFTTAACYLAGAAIGLGGGVQVGKILRHNMEYRADLFSAEVLQNGKPLAKALEKLKEELSKLKEGMPSNSIADFLEGWMHPPIDKRIERLNNWSVA